ncbi:MAG: hypothetical protein Q4G42_07305 [Neisseria sp.]|nr:hypothetical protein [Neisseria sp.]
MNLNAPTSVSWLIAVILGALGIIGTFVSIPVVSAYALWLAVAGWGLLVAATLLKGL